ncbi:cytochrome P450 [Kushneria indalinina]|uniref:Fatty-acid peroxygenase n=1 Tax=Kushneria indalinina DSM 14324 TaxID=1122140 RepID=A0A3D9DSA8_9GAMM|nr:cytochrome P450 [Kushneria indalinina]REC93571.1 fatty-acid peroxygenase [Kushneria indalinina DSM 14324]
MTDLPAEHRLDSTLDLMGEGYLYIGNRCQTHASPIFRARILFENTLCLRGAEAAKLFYNTETCRRAGAAPMRLQKTLFGVGGVQGLDDEAHRHRKAMFMDLMSPEGIDALVNRVNTEWQRALTRWETMAEVHLFKECQFILCRAVCAWAGVPLPEADLERRTHQLAAMIDGAGAVGPRHWQARRSRDDAENWIGKLVEKVRRTPEDYEESREQSALIRFSLHRDEHGELLPIRVVAVEILNVLRPTLAVSRYMVFIAHALHCWPETRPDVDDDDAIHRFVQEVRRYYPFFPVAAARLRHDVEWQGYTLPGGTRLLLDLYGTNHDPDGWEAPETFDPERFRHREVDAWQLIPQGGGDHHVNHRCPGEWITIRLMEETIRRLDAMHWTVPEQDLAIDLSEIPALPDSGMILREVHPRHE